MEEAWKCIPGYENLYQVSNQGRVRRLGGTPQCRKTRVLKPGKANSGYLRVALCKKGRSSTGMIHQLVMLSFIGEQGDRHVNHLNGDKTDNRLKNLEYCTPKENSQHASSIGLLPIRRGEKNGRAKLRDKDVRELLYLYKSGLSRGELQERFCVSKTTVQGIVTKKTWRHLMIDLLNEGESND